MAALAANIDICIRIQPIQIEESHGAGIEKDAPVAELFAATMLTFQGLALDRICLEVIHIGMDYLMHHGFGY